MAGLTDDQLDALMPGFTERRKAFIQEVTKPVLRWRIVERPYEFFIKCERDGAHVKICWGDTSHNIPRYGTKEQARRDAETICEALNKRDQ